MNPDAPRTETPDLRAAAEAVLDELDIIRRQPDDQRAYGLRVHIDTHNDLRAALEVISEGRHPDGHRGAVMVARAALSATPAPERLDVERLTWAMRDYFDWQVVPIDIIERDARAVAERYAARLRESGSPEPKP